MTESGNGGSGSPRSMGMTEEAFKARLNDPKFRRRYENYLRQHFAAASVQEKNGAGLLPDQTLREFADSFTTRYWEDGEDALPMSYDPLEPMVHYDKQHAVFLLKPEKDYEIEVRDFWNFLINHPDLGDSAAAARQFKDNVIYNFTALDDPHRILMPTDSGSDYAVAGLSLIRQGDLITVMLIAGENPTAPQVPEGANLSEENFQGSDYANRKNLIGKIPEIMTSLTKPGIEGRARLPNAEDLAKTIAIARFDLVRHTMQERLVYMDYGTHFTGYSDDVGFGGPGDEDESDSGKKSPMLEELDRRALLFNIAAAFLFLPHYLSYRIDCIEPAKKTTQLGEAQKKSLKARKEAQEAPVPLRVVFRTIESIHVVQERAESARGRSYTPPAYSVEIQGFWRYFANPDWNGKDEQGRPVKGRTWVARHDRWKDRPKPPATRTVYIKQSTEVADEAAKAHEDAGAVLRRHDMLQTPPTF